MTLNVKVFDRRSSLSNLVNPIKIISNLIGRYNNETSIKPHVFVVGAPRSGTTLMFSILSCHPSFASLDLETFLLVPHDIWNIEFYKKLSNFGGPDENVIKNILDTSNNLVNIYDQIAQWVCEQKSGERFVEKSVHHVFCLEYICQHFPNAKIINMIRDGRDCYVSQSKMSQLGFNVDKYANFWQKSIRARQKLGEHPAIIDIKYENLTINPHGEVKKIMDFLGEDFYEYQVDPNSFSKNSNVQKNHHKRLQKPITGRTIGQWKNKMTIEDIKLFEKKVGIELVQLNYELSEIA